MQGRIFGGVWAWVRMWLLALSPIVLVACGGGSSGGGGSQSPPPTPSGSLSYASGTHTFTIKTAITAISPTVTGTLSSFTVSPALPTGLSLDAAQGTISGTPAVLAPATTYTVSATISGGSTVSGTISIAVNDVSPSQVSYGASSLSFSATVASTTITPKSSGGAVVSWSVSPALPAGLNFSTTDGSISGTPTAASAAATYVVTAQNSGGQSMASLTIAVGAPPLLELGHQISIRSISVTSTNVLSLDVYNNWILWDYARASVIASGNSGCPVSAGCNVDQQIDMKGSVAAIAIPNGIEAHSTTDGHLLGTISVNTIWWRLASDGSYIVAGTTSGLSVWAPSGQLLFTHSGNYFEPIVFAAPSAVLVANGPAGQNVVETVTVPGGTATVGPQFNGGFYGWFADGTEFITVVGSTALIYSLAGVQQGSIGSLASTTQGTLGGAGNWFWAFKFGSLTVYPATGTDPTPAATFTFPGSGVTIPTVSGSTLGVYGSKFSLVDLTGATPSKTDFPLPFGGGAYAAASASQWVFGTGHGAVLDGTTLATTPRSFGVGQVLSMVGGSGHFALATAAGNILYFNSATLAAEGQIPWSATKLVLSTDGTVLVGLDYSPATASQATATGAVQVYDLPSGNLQYAWPASYYGASIPQDIALSGSGTVLGQALYTDSPATYTEEASVPTGGAPPFSSTFPVQRGFYFAGPSLTISPDGTLISGIQANISGASLWSNGTLVTAFNGVPGGWLDNSRLLVNNYSYSDGVTLYSGCTVYGSNGSATNAPCALPQEAKFFQTVSNDTIYVPTVNQVQSVSTGAIGWRSASVTNGTGVLAGSYAVFVSGTQLLAQPVGTAPPQ